MCDYCGCIFPVSVVTLGAEGRNLVQRAHQDHPSFLDVGEPSPSMPGSVVSGPV